MMSEQKQHQQHQLQQHIRTSFLPMLCSQPSMIRNVHIPNPFNKEQYSSSSGRHFADDPSLSPKVGCMGQVKKKDDPQHHNNFNYKLGMVFPSTTTSSYSTKNPNTEVSHGSDNNFSYSKLLRLFSSKTLLATPLPATNKKLISTTSAITCRKNQQKISSLSGVNHCKLRSRSFEDNGGFESPIKVEDMDPPLPVVIKRRTLLPSSSSSLVDGGVLSEGDNDMNISLWKRRSGGAVLKGLNIQQVHIPTQSTTSSI